MSDVLVRRRRESGKWSWCLSSLGVAESPVAKVATEASLWRFPMRRDVSGREKLMGATRESQENLALREKVVCENAGGRRGGGGGAGGRAGSNCLRWVRTLLRNSYFILLLSHKNSELCSKRGTSKN